MWGLAVLMVVGVLGGVAGDAQPPRGSLVGHVDVRRSAAPAERRPDVSALGAPEPRDVPDLRRAVVYLEGVPDGPRSIQTRGRPQIDQRNETFYPRVLSVTAGTRVDFPNSDSTFHNVFSLSRPKRFDLGRYPQGSSRSVVFDRPGIVRVFCDIHSHMSAFVLVFSHPYHTVADADGRYRIDDIPPGTYTVSAWHEGATHDTRTVTIGAGGGVVEVDFVVP